MKNTRIDTDLYSLFKEEFSKKNTKESTSISKKRAEAFDKFTVTGFPSTKHEEWKYTNLASLVKENFSLSPIPSLTKEEVSERLFPIEGNNLIFVNGNYSEALSTILSPKEEIEIVALDQADASVTEKYFARDTYSSEDGLSTLNTAFSNNGLYIKIKANKSVALPIFIYNISDARAQNTLAQPRLLILLEANAQATVLESYHTLGTNTDFTNSITEIVLKKDANLDYYKIQKGSKNSYHVGSTEILHEEKSYSTSTTITLSGALNRNNLNINLEAEHCEAYLYGLYLLNENQHVDNHTIANHAMPNCYSNELYKGVMDGNSSGVFNGKIFVKLDAQKTNAFQSNKNILLSKDASINTKPQLEIFADDVKCSHGATSGQLDAEALFYLRSRGIGELESKKFLLHAFANDIIEKIKLEPLKEILLADIEEILN